MNSTLKTSINRAKFFVALALMCSVFGFGAAAQTNTAKPLEPHQVATLIVKLKDVVKHFSPPANELAAVNKKWDERKDLVGKTKREVINLLFADVKSVIPDPGNGLHYEMYQAFTVFEYISDEQLFGKAPKTKDKVSKPSMVGKLVDLTYRMHPYVGIEETLNALPGTKDIKAATEEDRKNRIAGFDEALKINKQLTPAQKSFVRANYDQLIKITDKITEDAINKNFPTEQWVKEGLQKSYASKFTPTELGSLVVYFQGVEGQQVLKYIRISQMAELIKGNGGTLDFTEADKAEHDKFAATPLGKKFMTAYLKEATDYEKSKVNAAMSKIPNADGFAIYRPANLNKLFNKFVADNYKK